MLIEFILDDLRQREELAVAWIYQEYANAQGFADEDTIAADRRNLSNFDETLTRLLSGVLSRPEQREGCENRGFCSHASLCFLSSLYYCL